MTKKRNIKRKNTFSVLQVEDPEQLLEEEEPPLIFKIDKDKKKVIEGKERGKIKKVQSKSKGES